MLCSLKERKRAERSERKRTQCPTLAHGRLFVLSDLSELLTVDHLIWVKGVNEQMSDEQMSDEQMSEFPSLIQTSWTNLNLMIFFLSKNK